MTLRGLLEPPFHGACPPKNSVRTFESRYSNRKIGSINRAASCQRCEPHAYGEHTSLKHAWIEGAIESGIRAALEVNETPVELPEG